MAKILESKQKKRSKISINAQDISTSTNVAIIQENPSLEPIRTFNMMENMEGEEVCKVDLGGSWKIRQIRNSLLNLIGEIESVFLDSVSHSTIFLGTVTGSIMLNNCTNCSFHFSCGQVTNGQILAKNS